MVSWNAAAMFQHDPAKAQCKNFLLAKLSIENGIVLLQETHGDENDLRARCPQVVDTHWCSSSQGTVRATGGVMTLISKNGSATANR